MYRPPPVWYSPPNPMPHLLQEMAGRWGHQSVCLVFAIEVYVESKQKRLHAFP